MLAQLERKAVVAGRLENINLEVAGIFSISRCADGANGDEGLCKVVHSSGESIVMEKDLQVDEHSCVLDNFDERKARVVTKLKLTLELCEYFERNGVVLPSRDAERFIEAGRAHMINHLGVDDKTDKEEYVAEDIEKDAPCTPARKGPRSAASPGQSSVASSPGASSVSSSVTPAPLKRKLSDLASMIASGSPQTRKLAPGANAKAIGGSKANSKS